MIINSGIATLAVWFKLVLQGSELLTMGMASGNWVGLDSLERVPWDPWGPVTVFFLHIRHNATLPPVLLPARLWALFVQSTG